MGYGGWTFYTGAELVRDVCELAAKFPEDLSTHNRYNKIVEFIQRRSDIGCAGTTEVFPDGMEYLESQRRSYRRTSLGGSQPPDELESDRAELLENLPEAPRWQLSGSTRAAGVLGKALLGRFGHWDLLAARTAAATTERSSCNNVRASSSWKTSCGA